MQSTAQRKELTDEQRQFRQQHQALREAISVRGLTIEEVAEYNRLQAKIATAEEEHRRRKFLAKGEGRR